MAHVAGPGLTQEGADEKKEKRKTQSERHTEISRRGRRKERLGVTQHTTIIRGMRTAEQPK